MHYPGTTLATVEGLHTDHDKLLAILATPQMAVCAEHPHDGICSECIEHSVRDGGAPFPV